MVCEHLAELERTILADGLKEIFRGQMWTDNCREWVFFDCVLDRGEIRRRFDLPACVIDHEQVGRFEGSEAGFVCTICHDGVVGEHPESRGKRVWPASSQAVGAAP